MRRALALLFALAAALAFGRAAVAKELTRVTICGLRDACAVITDTGRLRRVPLGGATSVPAPRRQPFYWMTLTIERGGDAEEGGLYYLPGADVLGANSARPGRLVWLPILDAEAARLMREAVRGIEPLPPPNAWPRELKSTYRVIPDDESAGAAPSGVAVCVAETIVLARRLVALSREVALFHSSVG